MQKREVKKRAVIVVSTDKGLCGGLNGNLMREAAKFDRNVTVFVTAGRKASQFIARTKRALAAEFTYKDIRERPRKRPPSPNLPRSYF